MKSLSIKENPFALIVLGPLILFLLLYLMGFDGLYGQDSYEYLRYTKRLQGFFNGGPFPGDLVWPKGYLFLTALLSYLLPESLAGQLLSLGAFYWSAYFLFRSLRIQYPDSKFPLEYLVIVFLLSPYLLRLSSVMMADTLAILCLSASIYYSLAYSKNQTFYHLIAAVFWASFGAFSRYATLVPIAPLLLWLLITWYQSKNWSQALVIIIPIGFLMVHLYFEGNGSDFLNHHLVERWSPVNFFKNEFNSATGPQLPNVSYLLPNILFYTFGFFHPGFCFLLLGLLIFLVRKKAYKNFSIALWVSLILYVLFLSGISFQGSRYLCLGYPLLVILFFPAFQFLILWTKKGKGVFLLFAVLVQVLLFSKAIQPSFQMNQLEQKLASALGEFQSSTLYSFEVDVALQERGLDFNYYNLWAQEYADFKSGALVVFNEERFVNHYEGKYLMNNWNNLNSEHQLIELKNFGQGWKLYRIDE